MLNEPNRLFRRQITLNEGNYHLYMGRDGKWHLKSGFRRKVLAKARKEGYNSVQFILWNGAGLEFHRWESDGPKRLLDNEVAGTESTIL